MSLQFSKMHGLGNDFMVIDAISQPFTPDATRIKKWSNRHTGIGFDQLLIVESAESNDVDFKYRIFNADGGEVTQCGNGARCFARFVRENNLTDKDIIKVETNAGLIQLELISATRVKVNMGVPRFEPQFIPLELTEQSNGESYQISIDQQEIHFNAVSMGNPHMVMQVDDVDLAQVESLGPMLESHPLFPERVNVGFMQIINPGRFKLRVFERGVGETRACGSGACAAMVVGRELGLLDPAAEAELSGGILNMEWHGRGNPVMMTGDTARIYEGQIEI
ncbi:MAG: diaminopimelate epimerase [Gammaproteobacteria bacterium]|jgi:diaminopimelate epimerase